MVKWFDLGIDLLDSDAATSTLKLIEKEYNSERCCTEMFDKWLETKPEATWNDLVTSLENLKMYTVASNVIKSLNNGTNMHLSLEIIKFVCASQ